MHSRSKRKTAINLRLVLGHRDDYCVHVLSRYARHDLFMPKALKKRKNPAAVALGRLGGLKGGPATAKKLTAEERSKNAQRAVRIRWARAKSQDRGTGS